MLNKVIPGSTEDWLNRARSDLSLALIEPPEGVMLNELCFHAQQAIEKSIKAVLVHYKIEFRLVHDIDYLISLLPKTTPMPPNTRELVTMTIYAVMLRYPGDYEDITKEEYEWSIKAAKEVYHWAENIIKH